jgi:hypothetical protein
MMKLKKPSKPRPTSDEGLIEAFRGLMALLAPDSVGQVAAGMTPAQRQAWIGAIEEVVVQLTLSRKVIEAVDAALAEARPPDAPSVLTVEVPD